MINKHAFYTETGKQTGNGVCSDSRLPVEGALDPRFSSNCGAADPGTPELTAGAALAVRLTAAAKETTVAMSTGEFLRDAGRGGTLAGLWTRLLSLFSSGVDEESTLNVIPSSSSSSSSFIFASCGSSSFLSCSHGSFSWSSSSSRSARW